MTLKKDITRTIHKLQNTQIENENVSLKRGQKVKQKKPRWNTVFAPVLAHMQLDHQHA